MLKRTPLSARAIGDSIGVPVRGLRPPSGVCGLLDTFRVAGVEPRRDALLFVLPFDDPAWKRRIDAMLRFERDAWRAWWHVVAHLEPEPSGVLSIAPLVGRIDDRVRCFDLKVDGLTLPALMRPMVEWPSLEAHPLSASEARRLREGPDGFDRLATAIWDFTNASVDKLELRRDLTAMEPWQLLSDGRHLVPTQWRRFHKDFARLDVGKPCA